MKKHDRYSFVGCTFQLYNISILFTGEPAHYILFILDDKSQPIDNPQRIGFRVVLGELLNQFMFVMRFINLEQECQRGSVLSLLCSDCSP